MDRAQELANTQVYAVRDLLKEDQPAQSMEALIGTITNCVCRDTWNEVGGIGTIEDYQGTLVIYQTGQVHDKIAEVLDHVRTAIQNAGGPTLPIPQPTPMHGGGSYGGS